MKIMGLFVAFVLLVQLAIAQGGPYAPAAGEEGSTAIHADSNIFVHWADVCELDLGWINIADTALGNTSVGDQFSCIGEAGQNGVVSLGDGGSAIITFDGILFNGAGYDFAIFENSFSDTYLELAHVEVSSDGENYYSFPSVSLHQSDSQVGPFGLLDPTYIYNLAGKYRALYGSPFDLEELSGIPALNIEEISHIRITDVVGAVEGGFINYDSEGNIINDPYPTEFPSSGFDLDAVGLINWSLETSIAENSQSGLRVYPNPFEYSLNIQTENSDQQFQIIDLLGRIIWKGNTNLEGNLLLNTENWDPGMYIIHLSNSFSYPIIKR